MQTEDILDQKETTTKEKAKRPLAITVLCSIGVFGTVYGIWKYYDYIVTGFSFDWMFLFISVSIIVNTACLIGLWFMKKWAVYLFFVFFITKQFVFYFFNVSITNSIYFSVILIAVAFFHIKKMD